MDRGIDVASYQSGHPDLSGLAFCWIKATEGTSYVNPRLAEQLATARAAKVVVGFYHFLHPGAISAQVDYFLSHIPEQQGDMFACDWETPAGGGAAASCAEKDQWLHLVKQTRVPHKTVLYCNRDFWHNRDTTSQCADGLWIADPTTAGHPRVTHPWVFHQYATTGGTDQNVSNFPDRAALARWAGVPTATPPAPTLEQRVASLERRVMILEKK